MQAFGLTNYSRPLAELHTHAGDLHLGSLPRHLTGAVRDHYAADLRRVNVAGIDILGLNNVVVKISRLHWS